MRFQESADRAVLLRPGTASLRDLTAAWDIATPDQRNAQARIVVQSVEIAGVHVIAIGPQPEFAPVFNLLDSDRKSKIVKFRL